MDREMPWIDERNASADEPETPEELVRSIRTEAIESAIRLLDVFQRYLDTCIEPRLEPRETARIAELLWSIIGTLDAAAYGADDLREITEP